MFFKYKYFICKRQQELREREFQLRQIRGGVGFFSESLILRKVIGFILINNLLLYILKLFQL